MQRWQVQRLRYCANRLFYLLPENQYSWLLNRIEQWPDFAEMTALLRAITTGDIQTLLRMPGPAVNVFAERSRRVGASKLRLSSLEPSAPGLVDSLAVLLLHGACEVEPHAIEQADAATRELFAFCCGNAPSGRMLDDLSFMDEIRTLQIKRTRTDAIDFLDNRYSDDEDLSLEALQLGDDYYR